MKKILLLLSVLPIISFSQQNKISSSEDYSTYFEKAYQQYSSIPRGVLEAVAYTNTHIQNITHNANDVQSCMGLPYYYGVMGLVKDGKNVFRNNLATVSQLSGIPEQEIISSPEKNILAYAAAYAQLQNNLPSGGNLQFGKSTIESQVPVINALSELPTGSSLTDNFAMNTNLYSILNFLNNDYNAQQYNFPERKIDLQQFFGKENFKVLSSSYIKLQSEKISDANGNEYEFDNNIPQDNLKLTPPATNSTDYAPAIWNAAASCNYTVGRSVAISAVTIHDTEGSYAGSIAWFQDCSSKVSAHYVIRSSDGQVTQMVLEKNKAWHVGTENGYTIGIEHEGYQAKTGWYTTAMYNSSANLVKDICNSGYGINPTTCWNGASCNGICLISTSYRIKGHQHYPNSNHDDPGPNWDWHNYYSLLNGSTPPPNANPPANDNCSAAISLTPNTSCVTTSGDLAGATVSGMSKASCDVSSSSTLKDVWYKFTASASTHTITCSPSSGLDAVVSLYSSCSGTQLGCSDNGGGPGGTEKISATGLTIGNTYYVRIYSYGSSTPSTTTFNICVTAPPASSAPANDNCSNAIALTPNTSCVSTSGTIANATVSGMSKASCDVSSSSSLKDVWYKFTATASTHTITLSPSSGLDGVLSLYSSCSGTQLGCSDNGGGPGGTEKISASGLTVGNTYYVRIYSYGSSAPTTNTFNVCVTSPSSTPPPNPTVNCAKTYKTTIEGFAVYQHNSGAIMFRAKMAIDADGSPRAYGPNNSGLDYTANAGGPGNWWGVVTDAAGNPIVQTSSDPYPGMYVSTTSLVDNNYGSTKTQHYVNSEAIPFFVLPSAVSSMGAKLGDVAYVYNTSNGKSCFAIFADGGPSGKLGEGSIYLANQLGINSNARTGGTSSGIIDYVIFPGSGYGQGTIPSVSQINSIGQTKLNAIGGSGITSCIPAAPPYSASEKESSNENILAIEIATENSLTVYPNPFDGTMLHGKFSVSDDALMNVKIYDMTGREVFSKQIFVSSGEFTLPFDEKLENGIYILQGVINDKIFTERLLVK